LKTERHGSGSRFRYLILHLIENRVIKKTDRVSNFLSICTDATPQPPTRAKGQKAKGKRAKGEGEMWKLWKKPVPSFFRS
jgi:hypothetical protein